MKSRFLLLVIYLVLFVLVMELCTGCVKSPDQIVEMPISAPEPVIELPPEPKLPIYNLDKTSSPPVVISAYVKTVKLLINERDMLRNIISARD